MAANPDSRRNLPADRLGQEYKILREELQRFLDIGSGLGAVGAHVGYRDLVCGLGGMLNVEQGLAAILPQKAVSRPESGSSPGGKDHDEMGAVRAAAPEARLAVRNHPIVVAVVFGDLLARALDLAYGLDRDVQDTLARDLDRSLDRDIQRALARDLDRSLGVVLDRDRLRSLATDLRNDLGQARKLAHTNDLGLEDARNRNAHRAAQLAQHLASALAQVLESDRWHDSARRYRMDCYYAREMARARSIVPARDRVRFRSTARRLAKTAFSLLGLQNDNGLAAALLDGALDDFTQADLTSVNLAGIGLIGVRWSETGTRWPPDLDIDELRMISRETPPGSGIYTVTRPESTGVKREVVYT
jgi:hypothetical protein